MIPVSPKNVSKLQDLSQQVSAEFKEYAYNVSHDLAAPLRAIVEFSRILQEECSGSLDAEHREYLDVIISNGQKMQTMIQGLLTYSRLNTLAKPFTILSTSKLVSDCLYALRDTVTSTNAKVTTDVLPDVYADAEQLQQVFHVLIENALKFNGKNHIPRVHLSVARQQNNWCFSVADNGIGIQTRFYEKIFKLFQRLHTDEEYEGVGVGLTLAQKIVQRHGGNIWVEPNNTQGSIFYFTIPAAMPVVSL
ncbi:MAG: GHKL domain-containing protein [Proteobacteria bacterium]|nr:GHKL domain-containing protein [Pseudomonadota bacterium]